MSYISPIRHVYQTCLCVYILGSCLDIKIKWTHCKITRSISLARCHQWKGGMQGDVGECTERWRAGEDGVKAWWEIMTTIEIDPHLLTSRVAKGRSVSYLCFWSPGDDTGTAVQTCILGPMNMGAHDFLSDGATWQVLTQNPFLDL